jgi:5'-nucleotidase
MRDRPRRPNGRRIARGVLAVTCVGLAAVTLRHELDAARHQPAQVTLSIVGTSDLHGDALPRNGSGGLPLLAGYVGNLRAARAADGGAVLLIDAGDTFQGNIQSNLSEGSLVVDAYNAMRYTAQAVGNHDFDFGAIDSATGRQLPGDLRGALKARAAQARHPFLAANLMDTATGRPVDWPNVQPSALVEAAGVKVGIVGVMTVDGLRSTIAANVQGLGIAPLESTVATEAAKLRAAGAEVVIVAAHAGGRCERFDAAADLSSCHSDSEIFQLARRLPPALVDVIVAGHTHAGLAHHVNGIAIVQPFSRGQWFGRVDVVFDRTAGRVARLELSPPRRVCAWEKAVTGDCAQAAESGAASEYEGRTVTSDPTVVRAMEPALRRVRELQAAPLGVTLADDIRRVNDGGSPLGTVIADALRAAVPGADVAAINNSGRLWADLPAGPVTFGQLYAVFPFDNRLVRVSMTGAELSRWLANEARQGRLSAVGISGVDVNVRCLADGVRIHLSRGTERIGDNDRLVAVTIGAPTLNGNLASRELLGGTGPLGNNPVVREVVEDWFRSLGQRTAAEREAILNRHGAAGCPAIEAGARSSSGRRLLAY